MSEPPIFNRFRDPVLLLVGTMLIHYVNIVRVCQLTWLGPGNSVAETVTQVFASGGLPTGWPTFTKQIPLPDCRDFACQEEGEVAHTPLANPPGTQTTGVVQGFGEDG
ncbi:MAG: hypothetical protein ABW047_06230 [Nitrospiraceae bacterium]